MQNFPRLFSPAPLSGTARIPHSNLWHCLHAAASSVLGFHSLPTLWEIPTLPETSTVVCTSCKEPSRAPCPRGVLRLLSTLKRSLVVPFCSLAVPVWASVASSKAAGPPGPSWLSASTLAGKTAPRRECCCPPMLLGDPRPLCPHPPPLLWLVGSAEQLSLGPHWLPALAWCPGASAREGPRARTRANASHTVRATELPRGRPAALWRPWGHRGGSAPQHSSSRDTQGPEGCVLRVCLPKGCGSFRPRDDFGSHLHARLGSTVRSELLAVMVRAPPCCPGPGASSSRGALGSVPRTTHTGT